MVKVSEQGITNLASALAQFQGEVHNPSNSAVNPQFRSKYAPLDVVINTIKPVLAKYGLSFIQSTGSAEESVIITTVLIHESGEWIESDPLVLPAYQLKKGGEKDFNAQGAGSAITYGRRYSLSAILGLSSEDDDDGNVASGGGYKDSSTPTSNGGGLSESEKEKKRQEALAKAQARQNANKSEQGDKGEPVDEKPNEQVDKITPQQEKAIGNMINILARKNGDGFDKDAYLNDILSSHGATKLEEVNSDVAKEIISKINADRSGK